MAIEKIVVVDDELMIRKALETQLRNKRYSVASTGDLKGARKILTRDSFDLVFLDLRLPNGEGTDLQRHQSLEWGQMVSHFYGKSHEYSSIVFSLLHVVNSKMNTIIN